MLFKFIYLFIYVFIYLFIYVFVKIRNRAYNLIIKDSNVILCLKTQVEFFWCPVKLNFSQRTIFSGSR